MWISAVVVYFQVPVNSKQMWYFSTSAVPGRALKLWKCSQQLQLPSLEPSVSRRKLSIYDCTTLNCTTVPPPRYIGATFQCTRLSALALCTGLHCTNLRKCKNIRTSCSTTLKGGCCNLFDSFVGPVGHNIWWENIWNGHSNLKIVQICKFKVVEASKFLCSALKIIRKMEKIHVCSLIAR